MKSTVSLLITITVVICGIYLIPCLAEATEVVADNSPKAEPEAPLRQLVRIRSPVTENDDEEDEADRTLMKTSKGSGSGSKGSRSGGNGKSCGSDCGAKDFAYIHLQGENLITQIEEDPPIEGSTFFTYETFHGFAEYFDHGDDYYDPHKNKVNATVTGSCTILSTMTTMTDDESMTSYLAHCSYCVTYEGHCRAHAHPDFEYEGWRDLWDERDSFGGMATFLADIDFGEDEDGEEFLEGIGPISGCAGDLAPCANGGLAFLSFDDTNGHTDYPYGHTDYPYKISLKVPFNDDASCKLQEYAAEHFA